MSGRTARRYPASVPFADALVPPPEAASEPACPHCGGDLIAHAAIVSSPKYGAWHCNGCGSCLVRNEQGTWRQRPGHEPPDGWTGGEP